MGAARRRNGGGGVPTAEEKQRTTEQDSTHDDAGRDETGAVGRLFLLVLAHSHSPIRRFTTSRIKGGKNRAGAAEVIHRPGSSASGARVSRHHLGKEAVAEGEGERACER